MKIKKLLKSLPILLLLNATYTYSQTTDFTPAQQPITVNANPKPNIFLIIDDSVSMRATDMRVGEHFYGRGLPVCNEPADWDSRVAAANQNGKKYYNPFETGSYIPYNPSEHPGYDGSVSLSDCQLNNRRFEVLQALVPKILSFYKDKAYLGFGGLGKTSHGQLWNSTRYTDKDANHIVQPIQDMSTFDNKKWNEVQGEINDIFSNLASTPIYQALQQVSLYFRGYPVLNGLPTALTPGFINNRNYEYTPIYREYNLKQYPSPLKYRCTTNTAVLLTDGAPTHSLLSLFPATDFDVTSESGARLYPRNNKFVERFIQSSALSLHDNYKELMGVDEEKLQLFKKILTKHPLADNYTAPPLVDAAGKGWNDKYSTSQNLVMSGILFGLEFDEESKILIPQLESVLKETGGKFVSLGTNNSSDQIFIAMDNLLKDLVKSTSNAQLINSQLDKTIHSIQYRVTYDITNRNTRVLGYEIDPVTKEWKKEASWDSFNTVKANQGRFMTFKYESSTSSAPAELTRENIEYSYINGRKISTDPIALHENHLRWLRGETIDNDPWLAEDQKVMPRMTTIGSVVNSELANIAKDKEYVNLKFMSGNVKNELNRYVVHKNTNMPSDLMVMNANDGLVHFISIASKVTTPGYGERVAAYFPGFLAYRLPEISGLNSTFKYSMDGKIGIFEFKDSNGNIRTVGLSGMGAGGKGIVGYQIFKATPSGTGSSVTFSNTETKVTPLFEIFNESSLAQKQFGNLGYTYSGFEFFNRKHPSTNGGQGIAVFGNGYGNTVSSLYLVDIENGNLIKEIELNSDGGGASSPTLVVESDASTGYQRLKKIFVGDTSGNMYRVDIKNGDIASAEVNTIYTPSKTGVKTNNPITAKPLYTIENNQGWLFFGTGRNSDTNYDRGEKSKVVQYIVGMRDNNQTDAVTPDQLAQRHLKVDPSSNKRLIVEPDSASSSNLNNGWIIPLKLDGDSENSGERIVRAPRYANSNILFTTWGLEEYATTDPSGVYDPCVGDSSFSKLITLRANTGLIGDLYSMDKNTAGIIYENVNIGSPSGAGITDQGGLSGGDTGTSTLDKSTLDEINKANGSEGGTTNTKDSIGEDGKIKVETGDENGGIHSDAWIGTPNKPPFIPSRTSLLRLI